MSLKLISDYSKDELSRATDWSPALRRYLPNATSNLRTQAWCECTLATILQSHSTEDICKYWSKIADQIIQKQCDQSDAPKETTALFALGKWGAEELNLSSDIDLIIVSQGDSPQGQKLARHLNQDPQFRLDFDLRPGGRHGPIASSVDQFCDYYGNYGEAWERLALVRLRPVWGSNTVIDELNSFTDRYVYRKHLDFDLLEELKSLRKRIHEQNWQSKSAEFINLKLGIGGIRDLELFVHTLLVIHGGKDPSLKTSSTCGALRLFAQRGILPEHESIFLINHYWNLRHLENMAQCQEDLQTHQSPITPELEKNMNQCEQIVEGLLGQIDRDSVSMPADEQGQSSWLLALGFSEHAVTTIWPNIMRLSALSRGKERLESARQKFLFQVVNQIAIKRTDDKVLILLAEFLRSTRAKSSFYSLLANHPNLIEDLAHILSGSSYLSRLLIHRPELLDSFVYRSTALQSTDLETLLESLLDQKYLIEVIAGVEFLKDLSLDKLSRKLTEVADNTVKALANDLQILALGKWGGKELGLKSDLDFIFVTNEQPEEVNMKQAKRLIHQLAAPLKGGFLYGVDLRLRPSERGGPLITSKADLENYLSTQAPAWERQAYLKSRWLNDPNDHSLTKIVVSRGLSQDELIELERIRCELIKPNDIKYSAGGIIDVELTLQTLVLLGKVLPTGPSTEDFANALSSNDSVDELMINYRWLREQEQLSILNENHQVNFTEILLKNVALLETLDPRRRAGYELSSN